MSCSSGVVLVFVTAESSVREKGRLAADRCPDAIAIAASTQTRTGLDTKTDMPRTKATRTPTAQLMAHAQVAARRSTEHRSGSHRGHDRLVIVQSGALRVSCADWNPAE